MSVMRWAAIKRFLEANTHPDLAKMYDRSMEVQVNVAQDEGQRVGDFRGRGFNSWTDGADTWFPFRIPRKANSDPEDNSELKFSYNPSHISGIGMTGWDWMNRVSKWVAYDFDAITGHSERHNKKLSDKQLLEVKEAAISIPWVTVRKSTSGNGLHLYVMLNDVPTQNHNEHAALARSILSEMSFIANYPFSSKVDICGGNMWVYHRKMKRSEDGLQLIKQGEVLTKVPANWKEHVKVVSGSRQRILPKFIEQSGDELDDIFDELTGQRPKVRLDKEHTRLTTYLREMECQAWWDEDSNMLVTHTFNLLKAHEELKLKGIFTTISKGTEAPGDHNCFLFPMRQGGWVVRRFSPGCTETDTWEQDGSGWTRCFYNKEPTLRIAASANDGVENEKGQYVFTKTGAAIKTASSIGADVKLPDFMGSRPCVLKPHKDGRLVFQVRAEDSDDPSAMKGWLKERKAWKRIFKVQTDFSHQEEVEAATNNDIVRHVVTPDGADAGWSIKVENGWNSEPMQNIRLGLKALGYDNKGIDRTLGSNVFKPWIIVNKPFQPEYPGNREWNRNAAQLAFIPSDEEGTFKTWNKIFEHLGTNLEDGVKNNGWCQANGVKTGKDYLILWVANLIQRPYRQLPYLFFYGSQKSGKSIFHEAIDLLVTKGVRNINRVFESSFNGEMEGAILCFLEETELGSKNKKAYNLIKEWVTSLKMSIHRKGMTPFDVPNTAHFVHCANSHEAAPIFKGDTRITMVHVNPIPFQERLPKTDVLFPALKKEAPFFLNYILNINLPPASDRLAIPPVKTAEKEAVANKNMDSLQRFIAEECHEAPGYCVPFQTFYDRFIEYIDFDERDYWTKIRTSKKLPPEYPSGNPRGESMRHIGNLSFKKPTEKRSKYVCKGTRLVRE